MDTEHYIEVALQQMLFQSLSIESSYYNPPPKKSQHDNGKSPTFIRRYYTSSFETVVLTKIVIP